MMTRLASRTSTGGSSAYERVTNAYQKVLLAAYQRWVRAVGLEMLAAHRRGVPKTVLPAILHNRLPVLEQQLQELGRQNIQAAARVGVGKTASRTPSVQGMVQRQIRLNAGLISTSLIPDIAKGVEQAFITTEVMTFAGKGVIKTLVSMADLLAAAFAPYVSRVVSYSGGAWVAIFEAQKTVAMDTEDDRRVRWVLHPEAEHCVESPGHYGCPDLEGEYDSWASLPTVPAGAVTCRGNCRCSLEVEVSSGEWQRGG